ncbi:MAG: RDD family protein [Bacteroidota bacterium]
MRTIDITTTQNVTIEYELATLRERFFAFFIDLMIVLAIYMILFLSMVTAWEELVGDTGNLNYFFSALLPIACLIFYQLFSEILADGQSWGKRVMGLKVVRLDGQEPGLSDYLLRAVFHIVDTIFSMGVLASLLISSSNKSQRLGDMTANTTVIRIKFHLRFRLEDILKINSLDDYEPTYPEVRNLSEEDMLLIKNIISRHRQYKNAAHQEAVDQLIQRLQEVLDLPGKPKDPITFLKTLIRDYIVLTR